jgi:hypothetical protein
MVLSFQGGLYFTKAYTKGVPQPPVTDNSGFFKDLGCFVPPQLTDFADFPVNRGAGKRVKAAQGRSLFKVSSVTRWCVCMRVDDGNASSKTLVCVCVCVDDGNASSKTLVCVCVLTQEVNQGMGGVAVGTSWE